MKLKHLRNQIFDTIHGAIMLKQSLTANIDRLFSEIQIAYK